MSRGRIDHLCSGRDEQRSNCTMDVHVCTANLPSQSKEVSVAWVYKASSSKPKKDWLLQSTQKMEKVAKIASIAEVNQPRRLGL